MRQLWIAVLIAAAVLLTVPARSDAQVVFSPTTIQFDSPDHTKTCPSDGCLAAYKVQLWLQGVDPATGSPVSTYDLAKIKVTASGLASPAYQALLSDLTPLWAVPAGQIYVLRMVAVGDPSTMISAVSNASETFATCAFTLSSATGTVASGGGAVAVTVTANGGTCGWTASSNAGWATLSAASGTGSMALTLTAAANPGVLRTAVLTLAGQTYTLTQAGVPIAPRPVTNIKIK